MKIDVTSNSKDGKWGEKFKLLIYNILKVQHLRVLNLNEFSFRIFSEGIATHLICL